MLPQCAIWMSADRQQQYHHSKGWTHGNVDAESLLLERTPQLRQKITGIVGEAERFRPIGCTEPLEVRHPSTLR